MGVSERVYGWESLQGYFGPAAGLTLRPDAIDGPHGDCPVLSMCDVHFSDILVPNGY